MGTRIGTVVIGFLRTTTVALTTNAIAASLLLVIPGCDHKGSHETATDASADLCASGCEIVTTHLVTVNDSAQPGMLPTRSFYVERDKQERLFAAASTLDQVLVFGKDGQFLRGLGRSGAGPGEYRRTAYPLVGPGDTLFIHDYFLRRMTVVSPDLEIVRIVPDVAYPPDLVLEGGSFVLARQIPTPQQIGYPIHVMGPDGSLLRSFGTDIPEHRPDIRFLTTRIVGPGTGDTIWAAAPGRYVMERWDAATGQRLERVNVASSWFVGADGPEEPSEMPRGILLALFEDEQERIWVLLRDGDPGWKPPSMESMHLEQPVTAESYDERYDFVVEVVDPHSARVLASRRFDDALWLDQRSRLVTTLRPLEDTTTFVTFDIWKLHLQPKRSEQ